VRAGGYTPIRDYAAIGDGRTVAVVSRDGSIDWLCVPELDSSSVFAALLDARRGGRFVIEPVLPFGAERRYLPETNVLETTFTNGEGVVRVTDAMLLPDSGLSPERELARRVEGLSGRVRLRWRMEPRFGYAGDSVSIGRRAGIPVATAARQAIAVCSWEAGNPELEADAIVGRFELPAGTSALIALSIAHQEPLVFPSRDQVQKRLDGTVRFWRSWAARRAYDGPWRDAVIRSALALKLLVHAPSGAIAAAATTSLPEEVGGERNWDYRFCWIRDSAFTLDALLALGCPAEAEAFFWWVLHASQLSKPRLQVLYRLDGGASAPERALALDGYRASRPVRIGNGATEQRQLDIYGDLLETARMYAHAGGTLDPEAGGRLAGIADLVCRIWRQPDSGIWEVRSDPVHFTHSKMMCWVALDRACQLADGGHIPARDAASWRREAELIRAFVEDRCWSSARGSYMRFAGGEELDAALLLGVVLGYGSPDDRRLAGTVDAVRRELSRGPLLYRYTGEDGLRGGEGAFVCCSFWLVDALARCGRRDEAAVLMDELVGLANDVGLYAEEINPDTGEFLGNIPQGLVHLALINAAVNCAGGVAAMNVWGAVAGGFVGTLVLTTALRAGSEFGLTRMDLPFLLGTALSSDRGRAKAVGYLLHFAFGEAFALVYFAIFSAINHSGWLLGAIFGLLHGVFSGTALVNILLPIVHPRMGSPLSAADSSPLIEPPGFLMLNYGRRTPIVSLIAHIAYGAVVGGFVALAR
jgi:GH15 family glucan-1,4-alpha-glucosidase